MDSGSAITYNKGVPKRSARGRACFPECLGLAFGEARLASPSAW
jgi:hypothetical protein